MANHRRTALLIAGLLLLIAVGIAAFLGPLNHGVMPRSGPTPADPTIESYMRQIRQYDLELQKTLPPDNRKVAEALKGYAQRQVAERIEEIRRTGATLIPTGTPAYP